MIIIRGVKINVCSKCIMRREIKRRLIKCFCNGWKMKLIFFHIFCCCCWSFRQSFRSRVRVRICQNREMREYEKSSFTCILCKFSSYRNGTRSSRVYEIFRVSSNAFLHFLFSRYHQTLMQNTFMVDQSDWIWHLCVNSFSKIIESLSLRTFNF